MRQLTSRSATRRKGYRTPPEVAREYGVEPAKVLAWIRAGELPAINLATKPTGRPRFMIREKDIEAFEERRAAKPPVARTPRRKRAQTDIIQFFK
jgi:hypothetical protein